MATPTIPNINIPESWQDRHREATLAILRESTSHYGNRLAAIAVFGSVHRGEAIPDSAASDLDLVWFVHDSFTENDRAWMRDVNRKLEQELAGHDQTWINPARSVKALRLDTVENDRALLHGFARRFAAGDEPTMEQSDAARARGGMYLLKYDATVVYGDNPVSGCTIPPPGRTWAAMAIQSYWDVTRAARGLTTARGTAYTDSYVREYPLPQDSSLKRRKLARYAVAAGSTLLMAESAFQSYRGSDILSVVKARFPEWSAFLNETQRLYIHPQPTSDYELEGYLDRLIPWMDWVGSHLTAS